jgi:predicted nuclease of predicted toxin-antitoxin system
MVPTLFIDRDAWSHVLDAALRAAGIPFVAHRDVFRPDTPDAEWIAEVGLRGWVVVTRDQNIRRRPNELRAVRCAGLHLFALTSGNLSATETPSVIISAWRSIQHHVAAASRAEQATRS